MIVDGYRLPDQMVPRLRHLSNDLLGFLATCVKTQDQADPNAPIKTAPVDRAYVRYLCELWKTEDKIIIEKSRRLWVSWFFICAHLHLAFTNLERNVFFVSKKEDDAFDLVRKAMFVYENIPDSVWPRELRPTANFKSGSGIIHFKENNSFIYGIPSGSDQLRSRTASAIFFDEFAFMPECVDAFVSSKPTLQGGGRCSIVSTNPVLYTETDCFFWQLVDDRV